MNEREYNSKLISEKVSEIPVAPNDLLWAKLEAQLTVQTVARDTGSANTAGSTAGKFGALKLGIAITASLAVVAVILFALFRNKKEASPRTIPSQQIPSVQEVDSIKAGTSTDAEEQKAPFSLPGLPKKEVYITPDNVPLDSAKPNVFNEPLAVPDDKAPVDLRVDSIKIVPPAKVNIHLPVDTGNIQAPRKKEDGYYFDVQKKKKKKGS